MSAGGRLGLVGGARLADGASDDPYGLGALTTGVLMATVAGGVATVSTVTVGAGLSFASSTLTNDLVTGTTDTTPATSGVIWSAGGANGVCDFYTANGSLRFRVSQGLAGVGVTGTLYTNVVRAGGIAGSGGEISIIGSGGSTVVKIGSDMLSFFNAAAVVRQAVAALTNSITAGGVNDTLTNWTDLTTYSNDAAAIRNAIYQCGRKLDQMLTALGSTKYNLI